MLQPLSERQPYLDSGALRSHIQCEWEDIPNPLDIVHTYKFLRSRSWYSNYADDCLKLAKFICDNYNHHYKGWIVSICSKDLLQRAKPFFINKMSREIPKVPSKTMKFRRYNAATTE